MASGYDEDFVDPPALLKNYECPLCLLVTRDPYLTPCCGHHFCKGCLEQAFQSNRTRDCPVCKTKISRSSVVLNKHWRREVLAMKVRCRRKDRGCGWIGELGKLDSHVDVDNGDCQFVDVVCPNKCGEGLQRRHLDGHLSDTCPKRPFTCEYCHFKSTHEEVCKHHDTECKKFPLPCPNKCSARSVRREKMEEHLGECPLQLVQCEYAHVGCSEEIQRKDLASHLDRNVQKHLMWAFTDSQSQIQQLREQMEEKDRQIEVLKNNVAVLQSYTRMEVPPKEFTVGSYSYQWNNTSLHGCDFYTHRGVNLGIRVHFSGAKKRVELRVDQCHGRHDDKIKWPVHCTVTVYLLNQLQDDRHISGSKRVKLTAAGHSHTGEPDPLCVDYATIEDCSQKRNGTQYLKDNCLKFRVCVED